MANPELTPEEKRTKRAAADVRCAIKAFGLMPMFIEARSELDPEQATIKLARFASTLADAISLPAMPANRTASARDTGAAVKPTRRLLNLLTPKG